MGGGNTMQYITGGLQTVAGGLATAFGAPEIGIPLMTSGASSLAGGNKTAAGQGIGALGSIAGMAGGAGGGGMGNIAGISTGGGFAAPGSSAAPNINPSQIPSWLTQNTQSPGVQAAAAQPSILSQLGGAANSMAPAAQAAMNAMGMGANRPQQQQGPAQQPAAQPPRMGAQQPSQGLPVPTPQGGGAPNRPPAPGGGNQSIQQILAMLQGSGMQV